ncbi:MAG: redoxin family protein [Rickettsiales bacterium]
MKKSNRNRLTLLVSLSALAVFFSIAAGYAFSLSDKSHLPFGGETLDRPLPSFALTDTEGNAVSDADFRKGTVILNVFASWCAYCAVEHSVWNALREKRPDALVIGSAWADNPVALKNWLQKRGNPYSRVIDDPDGKLAMNLGVTGAPETYLIKNGKIVARFAGAISEDMLYDVLLPFLASP